MIGLREEGGAGGVGGEGGSGGGGGGAGGRSICVGVFCFMLVVGVVMVVVVCWFSC